MNSGISTDPSPAPDAGFQPWHLFVLLSMVAATVAVILSRQTHPLALLLLSAAVIGSGVVGLALHRAMSSLLLEEPPKAPLDDGALDLIVREKQLVLRSIKELEFDRSMKKVSEADFQEIGGRLRARAVSLMQALEGRADPAAPDGRAAAPAAPPARADRCASCGTPNDRDARFCKHCGAPMGAGS